MHAQDSGFSSMQLWSSRVFRQSRRKYSVRRLVITLERTRFCSYCVGLCSKPTRCRGWVVSVSACQFRDAVPILSSDEFFFLPVSEASSLKYASDRTLLSNVFSVAKWLASLRYQWWCVDSGRGSWFKSAIKCRLSAVRRVVFWRNFPSQTSA